jgi:hypothetical protein
MTLRTINIFLIVFILTFIYTVLAYLDIMVSLKYEIDNPTDCISKITGNNLCRLKSIYIGAIGTTFLLVIAITVLRIKTLSGKSKKAAHE